MLHYQELGNQELGSGVPLVVLHGLFGSGDNWRSSARVFSRKARVVLVDMPNHGMSPHTDDMRYPSMAESVRGLIEELGLGGSFVLGHSMGGKAAMALALRHPEIVRGLVVVDIAPRDYPPGHLEIIAGMREVATVSPSSRAEADRILARRVPNSAIRAFLLKSLVRGGDGGAAAGDGGDGGAGAGAGDGGAAAGDGGYRWALNIDAIASCYEHLTSWPSLQGHYEGPALFIAGGRSSYVGPEDTPEIERLFPRARLESIDNAGHWLHVEQQQVFTELVLDFLAEHS
ncbi:MAG: alpha/beta fold hydrolase [Spirochaetota bacterium]